MPRARKVKDKWREKKWLIVEAPPSFGSVPIAYIPITDPSKALGRTVETTLYDLLKQDPQHYVIKLKFQIIAVEGDRAKTLLNTVEYSREFLRSLVRRRSSMVSYVQDYITKDGFKVRFQVVAFTQWKINSSRKHAIRMAAHKVLTEKTGSLSFDQLAQEVVLQKLGIKKFRFIKRLAPAEEAVAPMPS
ncbi:MAG: 30S ribosomal protein S3ae [Nitrososphaerota archaeon]